MAKLPDWDDAALPEFETWKAERPQVVQDLIDKLPPWNLYRLTTSQHRVFIHSYDELEDDGVSLQVIVSGDYNAVAFERCVFGIKPEDLVECDLPGPDEVLGSLGLSIEEAKKLGGFANPEDN